jgi:hypothetical protein
MSPPSFIPAKLWAQLFMPHAAAAAWLLTEADPHNPDLAFGLCDLGLGTPELGYVSLGDLETIRGRLGLPIERDTSFVATQPLSAYAEAARAAGQIVELPAAGEAPAMSADQPKVGDRVFFWSGRGSEGYGRVRKIEHGRYFIDPEPDAVKGSDYRRFPPVSSRHDTWAPRDFGVRVEQLNTPAKPWFKDS